MASNRLIRIGIIGGGDFSNFVHFPAICELCQAPPQGIELRVQGIYNRDQSLGQEVNQRYGFNQLYPSLEALIADEKIDAYVVLLNPDVLLEVIRLLVTTGKPIFTEKPPGTTLAEAEEMAKLVKSTNLVAFNRRYSPLNQKFKSLLNELDRPDFVECEFFRYNRTEPGFLIKTGIHAINYLEYLYGPVATASIHSPAVWDPERPIRIAKLYHRSGLVSLVRFLQNTGYDCERYHVHGQERTYSLFSSLCASPDYPGEIISYHMKQITHQIEGPTGSHHHNLGIVAEYKDFLEAIALGTTPRSSFANAVNSMRIAEHLEYNLDSDFTINANQTTHYK